jgi:hypothetical protein
MEHFLQLVVRVNGVFSSVSVPEFHILFFHIALWFLKASVSLGSSAFLVHNLLMVSVNTGISLGVKPNNLTMIYNWCTRFLFHAHISRYQ